jgi:YidC/Oxa1 family membrane protein insertase
MNFKELAILLGISFAVTFLVQNFLVKKIVEKSPEQSIVAGESFTAPKVQEVMKPLLFDVDFDDTQTSIAGQPFDVQTSMFQVQFSSDGGSIERLACKRKSGTLERIIPIMYAASQGNRSKKAFLVALNQKTPVFYELIDHHEDDNAIMVTYCAHNSISTITKTYTVSKKKYEIGLTITVAPVAQVNSSEMVALQPRIFIPAPVMSDIVQTDQIKMIVLNQQNKLDQLETKDIEGKFWYNPMVVGFADRYFVAALIAQNDGVFIQRAYSVAVGNLIDTRLILEGPSITKETSWSLTFYCGPKEREALVAAHDQLLDLVDFGWWGFVARPMLYFITFAHTYVPNYGWVIILLTLLINLLLLPLTFKSQQSMEKGQEFNRKMAHIQQKYKNDPQEFTFQKNELARTHGSSMMLGCLLPMFLQFSIFGGLMRMFNVAFQFYQAPFIFGWINDLTVRDPYYILPTCAALFIIIQSPKTKDVRKWFATIFMALFIFAMLTNVAAGLALYVVTGVVFRYAQMVIFKQKRVAKLFGLEE